MPKKLALCWLAAASVAWIVARGLVPDHKTDASRHAARRAVLVGIDRYRPATDDEIAAAKPKLIALHMLAPGQEPPSRDWHALRGAVYDMTAMRELLTHRFGFAPENITALQDEHATRDGILTALSNAFVRDAHDGDVLFFFYSGHGSQMRNSLSATKNDQIDETIVPWDANAGYYDIRDKELARIFNQALAAHHVTLTAIFDSCHSGSITRAARAVRSKSEPEDLRDAADPYDGGAPEDRGALILSAAQYDDVAEETDDDSVSPEIARGAFSMSLMKVLSESSPSTPVVLMHAARSRLHNLGFTQEPVLAGTPDRLQAGLFGDTARASPEFITHITKIDQSTLTVTIDVGSLSGLAEGAIFSSQTGGALRLRVNRVSGLSEAEATSEDASAQTFERIHLNDVFVLQSWAVQASAPLRVWVPRSTFTTQQIQAAAREFMRLRDTQVHWITDASEELATRSVLWTGDRWELRGGAAPVDVTGTASMPDVHRLRMLLTPEDRLLIVLPPPAPWTGLLKDLPASVVADTSPESATYWLAGRLQEGVVDYAWLIPRMTAAASDLGTMPRRTDWEPLLGDAGRESLWGYAQQLGVVAAFLRLPESNGSEAFPYHLTLHASGRTDPLGGATMRTAVDAVGSNQKIFATATVRGGDRFDIALKADATVADDSDVPERWVYVFALDSQGRRSLIFGSSEAHGGRFPLSAQPPPPPRLAADRLATYCKFADYPTTDPLREICLTTVNVCPSYGVDTLFLISTDQPIDARLVLSSDGIRHDAKRTASSATRSGSGGVLGRLLETAGSAQPGQEGPASAPQVRGDNPEHFSVERLTVVSVAGDDQRVAELCPRRAGS